MLKTLLLALAVSLAAGAASAKTDCASLKRERIPMTTIESSVETPAPFSLSMKDRVGHISTVQVGRTFCRVSGVIRPTPTSNIHFETWLPTDWNGDYFQAGNGGLAGAIQYPFIANALNRGFAASSTDDGTSGSQIEWQSDPQRMLDFRDRAVHLTAVAGQALTRAYYGRAAKDRFFLGGSKGGQEGMQEVQAYPDDFDGVVAMYPAVRGDYFTAVNLWRAQQMMRTPSGQLKGPQLELLRVAALKACAGKDGGLADDGFLTDPRACHFDAAKLMCKAEPRDDCLTADQVATARALYAGPSDGEGKSLDLGLLPGGEAPQLSVGHGWSIHDGTIVRALALENSMGRLTLGEASWTYRDFNISKHLPILIEQAKKPPGSSFDPNLRAFQAHGGKLILIHGWDDNMVPPQNSPLYWDLVVADQAKAAGQDGRSAVMRTNDFFRLFMIPGYGHGSGDGLEPADPLAAIVDWVKSGKAPATLPAVAYDGQAAAAWSKAGKGPPALSAGAYGPDARLPVSFKREVCAWPNRAEVTGGGVVCHPPTP
jgi:feruloyl esterase